MVTQGVARGLMAGIWCAAVLCGASAQADEEMKQDNLQRRVDKLTKVLELTADQHTQVQAVTQDCQARRTALKDQLEALRQEEDAKISALLTPDQQTKFGKWQERKAERRKEQMERRKDKKDRDAHDDAHDTPDAGKGQ